MSATAAQIEANRQNAKNSTGPTSEQGKANSSQNACRHNLTGGPALAPGEDPKAYQDHLEAVFGEYAPDTPVGEFVVRQIAEAMWRIARCLRMEDELMELSANPFLDEDETIMRRLERLERYRQAIERTYQRFQSEWRKLVQDAITRQKLELENEEAQMWSAIEAFARPPRRPSTVAGAKVQNQHIE